MKFVRWFIGIVGGILVGLWIAVALVSRAPVLQRKLVEALNEKMEADVDLESFDVQTFPLLRIRGDNLKLRLKGQKNPAPFIEIRHFEVSGGIFGLLRRQRRFNTVELSGLRITIPPRTSNDKEAGEKTTDMAMGPILIEKVTANDAELIIVPKNPLKQPKVFSIHELAIESVGFNRTMPFVATLTNPIPKGEIATKGTFGPWVNRDPGGTPVNGTYAFNHADLNTIKGISGILKSIGEFAGRLDEIDVKGTTEMPDFAIDVGGTPLPLSTKFHAVVDGTNGDTYLKQVDGKLGETTLSAAGAIESQPGVKGRTIKLDVKIIDGRLTDVLQLAVKAKKPVMLGAIAMQAALLLPPGDAKVIDRLQLDGRFALDNVQFTDATVQAKFTEMSLRAQGKPPDGPAGKITTDMRGRFILKDGTLSLQPLVVIMPGAGVNLVGVYGLRSQALDFTGTVGMDATISQAIGGGVKSFFLKAFDPIFRKDGKGAVIPITIKGPREQPKFGVEWGKVLK